MEMQGSPHGTSSIFNFHSMRCVWCVSIWYIPPFRFTSKNPSRPTLHLWCQQVLQATIAEETKKSELGSLIRTCIGPYFNSTYASWICNIFLQPTYLEFLPDMDQAFDVKLEDSCWTPARSRPPSSEHDTRALAVPRRFRSVLY